MEQIENRMAVDSQWQPHMQPRYYCRECEGGIFPESAYFDIDGDVVCENCIYDYVRENFRRYCNG